MYPQINIKHNIGNTINIPNQLDVKTSTYLSSDIASGVTAVPVDNAIDFSADDIMVLLSSVGAENSEIVKSTAHTATGLTTLATTLAHNRGDIVSEIKYDQISVFKSSTIDGTYTLLETKTFYTTQQSTIIYDAAGLKTDYYKVQWKNSNTSDVSDFSAPMSVTAYPTNSVATIIYPVLKAMGVQENDTRITIPFCLSAVDDARKFTEGKLFGIRHSWQQEFEFPIKLLAGTNYVELPADIDFSDTDRSVLAARFLLGNVMAPYNMRYIDKRNWNQISYSVQGGINQAPVAISGTEITLNNVGDFPDSTSGVAYVATDDYDQTIMQIAYTGVDASTNKLTGVTGVTREIPVNTRVWSSPTISQPIYYTVYDGKMFFDRIIPDSLQGNNVYIDYYKKIEEVEDLYQVLGEHYREIYKWYLRYAIKYRKDTDLPSNDPDLVKFEDLVQALVNNLYTGQTTGIITN